MRATRDELPILFGADPAVIRGADWEGLRSMIVCLPAGTDLAPVLKGLPNDLCPCPHWGYMLKGRVRMHTTAGHQDFVAGEAFYWAPGHAPEALEDSEYVDFSPTAEFAKVVDHITSGAGEAN